MPPGHQVTVTLPPAPGGSPELRDAPESGEAGPRVPGHEVLGALGHGGMGVVYKAREVSLDRIVALKMVLAGPHVSAELLARFRAESHAVARLVHPNIVQIYGVGELDGLPYFTLEFVAGGTLARKLGGMPQPPRESAHLVETLARAIDFAHSAGVVHRDLKPQNILLGVDGVPKVADFGLAKRTETDSSQTHSGAILGTPAYMAPEQATGSKEVGPSADVYALGAILYECLTGRPPFAGASVLETLDRVRTSEPVSVRVLQPGVPHDLETICLKCLQKAPARRYGSAAALAEDLHRFLADEPIRARPVGRLERLARWRRRNPGLAGMAAAVLFLLAATAVVSTGSAVWISVQKREVERNAEAARKAQAAAEHAQGVAETEQQKAAASARVADEQRGLALDAFATLVTKVQQQLQDAPETQKLRQELLQTALDGLGKISASAGRSRVADQSMATAHHRMGALYLTLGSTREARREYERLYAITRDLAAADPDSDTARRNLSIAVSSLGDICSLENDRAAARGYYQELLQMRLELVAADPGELHQVDLATAYVKLGNVSAPTEARRLYGEALALREAIARAHPKTGAPWRDVWVSHRKLAELALRERDPAAARPHADECLRIARLMAADSPGRPRSERDVAESHEILGALAEQEGKAEEAREQFREGLKRVRPLALKDRSDIVLQTAYVMLLARAGEHAEAAREAEQIRRAKPGGHIVYNVACCYALCSAAAGNGDPGLRQKYADLAVAALREVVAGGMKNFEHIRTDRDLDAIRGHPEFAEILKGVKP